MKIFRHCTLAAMLCTAGLRAAAGDKLTLVVNRQTISVYRTADLESAKKEAAAAHKPIAWIASSPKAFEQPDSISGKSSSAATLHAFYALRTQTVLVFEDAYEENHKVLPLVDQALHTPNPHYTPPTVVFLDPGATHVLATVTYEGDYVKRARALAKALEDTKGNI
jgi:hypothetical protein